MITDYNNFLDRFRPINELFVHNKEITKNNCYFVLYKGDVWFLDENTSEQEMDDIMKKIGIDIDNGWRCDDIQDLLATLKERYPQILVGAIYKKTIILDGTRKNRHSSLSVDLQKLKKLLNYPVKVEYGKNIYGDNIVYYKLEDQKKLKDSIFYHGTTIKYIRDISRLGLIPTDSTNYEHILHDDKIFLTLNTEYSLIYAFRSSIKNGSFPIILKLRVPDTSKIVWDYDNAIDFLGTDHETAEKLGYTRIAKMAGGFAATSNGNDLYLSDEKKKDITIKLGVMGYEGRIPASYIEGVMIDIPRFKEWCILKHIGDDIGIDSDIWNSLKVFDKWKVIPISEIYSIISKIENKFL